MITNDKQLDLCHGGGGGVQYTLHSPKYPKAGAGPSHILID